MNKDALAPVFKALADPTRRRVLDLLREGPRTTGQLTSSFDVSRFAVMKHLGILEQAGLVVVRRRGRERWNHLNAVPLQRVWERWLRPYEASWADRLIRLQRVAETGDEDMPDLETLTESPRLLLIEQEIRIDAPREKVFDAMTGDISPWWGAPYLQSAQDTAESIVLEPTLGGRLQETWADGEGSIWAVVTNLKKNERIILTGPMALNGAVHGVIRFDLEADGQATILRLRHSAVGEVTEELQANYRGGWQDLLGTRLKAWVERGERMGIGHEPR